MRSDVHPQLKRNRIRQGPGASTDKLGNMGAFMLRPPSGIRLQVISDDGTDSGWEHVSVTPKGKRRCPTWEEMCWVKDVFWKPEEMVVQYHPPESEYVNAHPFVLHLWRSVDQEMPAPPTILVG